MKNFQVNLDNQQAQEGEKLISYKYTGGIFAVLIATAGFVLSSALFSLIFFFIILIMPDWEISKNISSDVAVIVMIISGFCMLVSLAAVIVLSIFHYKRCRTGFDIYSDKIIFTDDILPALTRRSLAFAIVFSVLFTWYRYYWLFQTIRNIRILTNGKRICVGEFLLLMFVPFYNIYWFYTRSKRLKKVLEDRGYYASSKPGLFCLFAILGLDFISMIIMQKDVNTFEYNEPALPEESRMITTTFYFKDTKQAYVDLLTFNATTETEKRSVMLTSRGFKKKLNMLLAANV